LFSPQKDKIISKQRDSLLASFGLKTWVKKETAVLFFTKTPP
jgi:hypothetical protein